MKLWRKPLDSDEKKPPQGRVHILIERCKGCGFCVTFCPKQVLEPSPDFNRRGYHPPVVIHPQKCVNCGLCAIICAEFAIWTSTVEDIADTPSEITRERTDQKA